MRNPKGAVKRKLKIFFGAVCACDRLLRSSQCRAKELMRYLTESLMKSNSIESVRVDTKLRLRHEQEAVSRGEGNRRGQAKNQREAKALVAFARCVPTWRIAPPIASRERTKASAKNYLAVADISHSPGAPLPPAFLIVSASLLPLLAVMICP